MERGVFPLGALAVAALLVLMWPQPAVATSFGIDKLVTNDSGNQDYPAIAVGPNSNTNVIWQDNRLAATYHIYFSKSTDNGSSFGSAVRVDDAPSGAQSNPQLAVDTNGKIHAAWSDARGSPVKIYYSNSTDNGSTWSANVAVDSGGSGAQNFPSIALDTSNNIYVAWDDARSGTHIYIAKSANGGTSFGTSKQVDASSAAARYPWVCGSPNGNITVTWQDSRATNWDVLVRASSDGTANFGSEVNVTPSTSGTSQTYPRMAAGTDSALHLAWSDDRAGNLDVYYGHSSDGSAFNIIPVNDTGLGTTIQERPALAVDTSNMAHIAWRDRRSGTNYQVYYAQSNGTNNFTGNVRVDEVASGVNCDRVGIAVDGANVPNVVWQDTRSGNMDIYYDRSQNAPPYAPDLVSPANDTWVTTGTPTFTWTFKDMNSSDTQSAYQLHLSNVSNFATTSYDSGTVASSTAAHTPVSAIAEGIYYWRVRNRDNGGVWGPYCAGRVIKIDTGAPFAAAPSDEGVWCTSPTVNWTWTASVDTVSGIAGYYISIGTSAGGADVVLDQWTVLANYSYVSGTNGTTYYAKVKAADNATNVGAYGGNSNGITVDVTVPTAEAPADSGTFTNSSLVKFTWAGSTDFPSGISGYYISVGSGAGLDDIVKDAWAASASYTYAGGLNGVTYYAKIKAKDNAGNIGSFGGNSDGITVDISIPTTYTPVDNGTYSNKTGLFWYWPPSWDSPSGIKGYYLSIGTSYGANDTLADFYTTATNYTLPGAADGTTYYCRIFAEDNAGNLGPYSASSDGITVDTTAPSDVVVFDEGDYSRSNTTLKATWTSALDEVSGVLDYWYAIGTTPNGTDIVSWTSLGGGTSVTKTGLSLVNGTTYYITVKARNGSKLWTNLSGSDGITVDVTVPAASGPTDSGFYSITTSVTWTWNTSFDFPSGIKGYYITIGTTVGGSDIVKDAWTPDEYYTFPSGQNGKTYFATIKAADNAGNIGPQSASSDGVLVDVTVPVAATPVDDGTYSTVDVLLFNWSVPDDAPSGIDGYFISIGTSPGGSDIVKDLWTLETAYTLTDAIGGRSYYIRVRALDKAGNLGPYSASSDGITVDTTPPSAVVLTSGATSKNASALELSWSISFDPETSVIEYQYALGTTAGATDVLNWTGAGLRTSLTAGGLALENGKAYYVSVRAMNAAGLWSEVAGGTPVTVDTIAPSAAKPAASGAFVNSSVVTWLWNASKDAETGIGGYQIFVGTKAGMSDVVDGAWCAKSTYSFLGGLNGVTYYTCIIAVDRAGNEGERSANSDGVTVDTSVPVAYPPVAPSAFSMNAAISWNWTPTSDAPSGILGYYVSVGTFPGGDDIVKDFWTTAAGYKFTGGQDGKTYYIKLRAKDNAGNLGGYILGTTSVTVDLVKPTGTVKVEGGATMTSKTGVMLTFIADADVTEMKVGSDTSMAGAVWEPFAQSRTWTLSAGDSDKIVFVRFRDRAGWESDVASATIGLKTSVGPFSIDSSAGSETGDKSTTISATVEPGSRAFVNGKEANVNAAGHFSTTVELQEGSNVIVVTVRDSAGNSQTLTKSVWRKPVFGAIGGSDNSGGAYILAIIAILFAGIALFFIARTNRLLRMKLAAAQSDKDDIIPKEPVPRRRPPAPGPGEDEESEEEEENQEEGEPEGQEREDAGWKEIKKGRDEEGDGETGSEEETVSGEASEAHESGTETEEDEVSEGPAMEETKASRRPVAAETPERVPARKTKLKVVTQEGDIIVKPDGTAVEVEPKIISEWSPETGDWTDPGSDGSRTLNEALAGEGGSVDKPISTRSQGQTKGDNALDDFARTVAHREEKSTIPGREYVPPPTVQSGQRLSAKQIYEALYGKKPGAGPAPALTGAAAAQMAAESGTPDIETPATPKTEAESAETAEPAPAPAQPEKMVLGRARCAGCKGVIPIYSMERPLKIECPHCGMKGMIK